MSTNSAEELIRPIKTFAFDCTISTKHYIIFKKKDV